VHPYCRHEFSCTPRSSSSCRSRWRRAPSWRGPNRQCPHQPHSRVHTHRREGPVQTVIRRGASGLWRRPVELSTVTTTSCVSTCTPKINACGVMPNTADACSAYEGKKRNAGSVTKPLFRLVPWLARMNEFFSALELVAARASYVGLCPVTWKHSGPGSATAPLRRLDYDLVTRFMRGILASRTVSSVTNPYQGKSSTRWRRPVRFPHMKGVLTAMEKSETVTPKSPHA
jgi:hypothetical protein